jgi:hypothetical protein
MARKFLTPIDLSKNELQNARIQNLAADPSTPVAGQVYYNTVANEMRIYNGTAFEAIGLNGVTADAAELNILDGATLTTTELNYVDGVTSGIQGQLDLKAPLANPTFTGTVNLNTGVTVVFEGATANDFETTLSVVDPTADRAIALPNASGTAALVENKLHDFALATASVDLNNQKIINLTDPANPQDAANKRYVDAAVVGIDWKPSVRAATTAAITLATGLENGDTIDGVTLATGNRVLVKDQADATENGIYVVAVSGAPTRSTDADTAAEITASFAVFVEEGTANADSGWTLTNNGSVTIGTTQLTFTQFTGLGQITAGAGLTKTANTLDVIAGSGIVVNANDVTIDTAVVVRKYAVAIGDGSATSITVTHNLNTRDVTVGVYSATSTYDEVECDILHATVNTVTLLFSVAPTAGQYRAVVHG